MQADIGPAAATTSKGSSNAVPSVVATLTICMLVHHDCRGNKLQVLACNLWCWPYCYIMTGTTAYAKAVYMLVLGHLSNTVARESTTVRAT